jgi:Family of unknown function (DUF6527)
MTGRAFRVLVVSAEGWREWRAQVQREPGGNPAQETLARVLITGETPFRWHAPAGEGPWAGLTRFTWTCPGCGGSYGGTLGPEPVSGWDEPRWVNSGTPHAPTLTPSLGCPLWRAGRCEGHWWLRDGLLEPA